MAWKVSPGVKSYSAKERITLRTRWPERYFIKHGLKASAKYGSGDKDQWYRNEQ